MIPPSNEELTYRHSVKLLTDSVREIYDARLVAIEQRVQNQWMTLSGSITEARIVAQTANDALQRLLEAQMHSSTALTDARMATLREVDDKADKRQDASASLTTSLEQRLVERVVSLQQLIDLRARMNEDAVNKANEATEKRFESFNELRDQTRSFVTGQVLDARVGQIDVQVNSLDRQMRIDTQALTNSISELSMRVERREASESSRREARSDDHMTIGSVMGIVGGVVSVLGLIAMVSFGYIQNRAQPGYTPTVGADTKRVDDLISRMNEMSSRMNTFQAPQGAPPPPTYGK